MSSNATTSQPTSNIATLPSPTKPQTSCEVVQANVNLLIEQLEAGHSEGLTAYLTAMGRFHSYSFGKHSGDCTAAARRNPRCRSICVEPVGPEGNEGPRRVSAFLPR